MAKSIIYENIIKAEEHSFLLREDYINYASEVGLHIHPEFEIAFLSNGGGIRCIDDISEIFGDEDVVLVPGDVPHCWIFDPAACPEDGIIRDCSCQFELSMLEKMAVALPELAKMLGFYRDLNQAIKIEGEACRRVIDFFDSVRKLSAAAQALEMASLLNFIYESGDYKFIGSPEAIREKGLQPRMKFNAIQKLVTENYSRTITLDEAAALLSMNKTAFCNAFKRMYGTTFVKFLTSYRMQVAARLLETTASNISDIAYRVGFNDVPHFNRTFSEYFHSSPGEYRRKIGR